MATAEELERIRAAAREMVAAGLADGSIPAPTAEQMEMAAAMGAPMPRLREEQSA